MFDAGLGAATGSSGSRARVHPDRILACASLFEDPGPSAPRGEHRPEIPCRRGGSWLASFFPNVSRGVASSIASVFQPQFLDEQCEENRRLLVDALDRLAEQPRHREHDDLAARRASPSTAGSCWSRSSCRWATSRIRSIAGPDSTPCTAHASTRAAPLSLSAVAAFVIVPAVSTMSSWMMQVRPSTSPITFITSAVPSSIRRLSIDGELAVEPLRVGARPLGAARIGRHQRELAANRAAPDTR